MAQGEKIPVVMEAAKGVPGGVASLGADGKVPQEQLPEFGISNAEIKQKLVDDDCLAITDSEANNRTKRVFWSNIKEILGGLFVPFTRKINNKALSSDVTLDAADVGAADRNFLQQIVAGTGSAAYHGWIEVGRIKIDTSYTSVRTIFSVCGVNGRGSGILSFSFRVDGTANVIGPSSSLYWLTLDTPDLLNSFAIEQDGDYAVLYLELTGMYQSFHIGILDYGFSSDRWQDPSFDRLFKLTNNMNGEGNRKETINAVLTSSLANAFVYPNNVIGGLDYTTVRLRGSGLRNADTNPTANGTINWTYG